MISNLSHSSRRQFTTATRHRGPAGPRAKCLVILLSLLMAACDLIGTKPEGDSSGEAQTAAVKVEPPIPTPAVKPVPPTKPAECKNSIDGFIIVGEAEYVTLEPENIRLKARIDTGAQTTSLGVVDMREFERDGKRWVQFWIVGADGSRNQFRRQVQRVARIKRHDAEPIRRMVIIMALNINGAVHEVEVSLADREQFEYPLLVGRNYLQGRALVDVNRKFAALGDEG